MKAISAFVVVMLISVSLSFPSVHAQQSSAQIDPSIGINESFIVSTSSGRTEQNQPMTVEYPRVDSLTVPGALLQTPEDPFNISVYITNPSTYVFSNAKITITVYEPISHFEEQLPSVVATLPASSQVEVLVPWLPPEWMAGLDYELRTDLEMPMTDVAVLGTTGDLIENGTFDAGCSGWTLRENYPPTLGSDCAWGYLHTYSSMYNTTDRRATYAYQTKKIKDVNWDQYCVQFSAKYSTESGMYGYGLADTRVFFCDSTGLALGWIIQRAYEFGVPEDIPTEHYSLVQEGVWHSYQQSISSLLSFLPGVDRGSVYSIGIMTYAMPVCAMPYCNPEADVYLDDVAVTDGAPLHAFSQHAVTVSNLTDEIIGDRTQMIQDCMGGYSPCQLEIEVKIPAIQSLSIWNRSEAYICAAAVFRADGDELRGRYAEMKAGMIWMDYFVMLAKFIADPVSPFAPSYTNATDLVKDLIDCEMLDLAESREFQEQTYNVQDHYEDLSAWRDVLRDQTDSYRYYVIVEGAVQPSVVTADQITDMSTIRHSGVYMGNFPDPSRRIIAIDDSVGVFEDDSVLGREDSVAVNILSFEASDISIGVLYQNELGTDTILLYDPVFCFEGAELSFAFNGNETVFALDLDRNGDGVPDTTLYPASSTDVQVEYEIPSAKHILEFDAYPNPFNPITNIAITIGQECDLVVNVYDVGGRLVSKIFNDIVEVGTYCFEWDGLNDEGDSVVSGVYFISASAGSERISKRIVCLR